MYTQGQIVGKPTKNGREEEAPRDVLRQVMHSFSLRHILAHVIKQGAFKVASVYCILFDILFQGLLKSHEILAQSFDFIESVYKASHVAILL